MQSTLRFNAADDEKVGRWYGCVFGVDEDKDVPEHSVDEYIQYDYRGRLHVGTTKNQQVRNFFYKLCAQLQKFGEILISFHNGYTDSHCAFHGYHWHVYVHARIHPTSDARWGKELQALARASPAGEKMYLAAMAANSHALLRHIMKPPREIKWHQGAEMTELMDLINKEELEQTTEGAIDWDPAKLKTDRNVGRIKCLEQLMEKYATISQNILRKKMLQADDCDEPTSDWNKYVQILATPSFEQLWKKAVTVMKSKYGSKLITKLFDLPLNTKDPKYIPLAESMKLFSRWCVFQQIDEVDFVTKLFKILCHKVPKYNTFSIKGEPNAGKSFILRSLLPWYRWWGEIRLDSQGYAFAFENAVDVGIIMIEEPCITPIQVEQMKMIMEGAETWVKCKSKGDELVTKTPILITHNDSLSRFVSTIDRDAMDSRMFKYQTKACDFLKDYNKLLNPGIWPILYKLHGLDVEELMENDDDIPTYSQQIQMERTEEIKEMVRHATCEDNCPERKKLRQVDGPYDCETDEESDCDEDLNELYDGMKKMIGHVTKHLTTLEDVTDNRMHEVYQEFRGLDLSTETNRVSKILDKHMAFWSSKHWDRMKQVDAFEEDITKNFNSTDKTKYYTEKFEYKARKYPIWKALHAIIEMVHVVKANIEMDCCINAADAMVDKQLLKKTPTEIVIKEKYKADTTMTLAPKADRKRKVDLEQKESCKKQLQM